MAAVLLFTNDVGDPVSAMRVILCFPILTRMRCPIKSFVDKFPAVSSSKCTAFTLLSSGWMSSHPGATSPAWR